LFLGPTINGIFGFGEEFGWRGYLLPKLMPLGKLKAYTIVGIAWGLWHAPLIVVGFNYPGHPILGILAMIGVTTALGIYMNELTLRNNSCILAAWIHGAFNGQAYGIWRILFPNVNPLVGGFTGLVGIGVWLVAGLLTLSHARVVTTASGK
jgi:membrane protease YdiL (CAAX protease family)